MMVIKYRKQQHRAVIEAAVRALKEGKVVAYPTDTSYGLAVDATNLGAVRRLYRVKERQFTKPVHVIPPSASYARKVGEWSRAARKLAARYWPGPVTLILPYRGNDPVLRKLGAKTGTVGLRMPKHELALALTRKFGRPITTTSANPSAHLSGGYDSYSAEDILSQFEHKQYRPDLVIDAGRLARRKPSTMVRVTNDGVEVLREGPVSEKQILKTVSGFTKYQ